MKCKICYEKKMKCCKCKKEIKQNEDSLCICKYDHYEHIHEKCRRNKNEEIIRK